MNCIVFVYTLKLIIFMKNIEYVLYIQNWWEYYINVIIFSVISLICISMLSVIVYLFFSVNFPRTSFFSCFSAYIFFPLFFTLPLRCIFLSFPHISITPYIHAFILDSVRGGEVHHIFACLPTEDIHSSLSRGQDKDYFICWNTFKRHLQWQRLFPAGEKKINK